ncbi:MAG: TonB-dependent receptor, partial [Ignavibacteriaceae bacterium]|nr:TonB-dependent receptor [Ignavibacteriaceae bacterium]
MTGFYTSVEAQTTGNLRGIVSDSLTGEIIPYANIVIETTKFGASSNSSGYYFIPSIPVGQRVVKFSCIGYQTNKVEINIKPGVINDLNIKLTRISVDIDEVTIVGERNARENETDLGLEKISVKDIELQPVGAEMDIFRVIQNNPGVNTTGDATSKYYVRGGGSDQNLVLLNGATVYNPFHALGIFSVIDPEIISSLEFYKGGFTPSSGDRLSSILNIITRDGNKNFYQGTLQAGLLSGKVAVEGPIPGGSFLMSGRKSYYSGILRKYLNEKDTPFDFYDLSLKVNFSSPSIDENSKFSAHTFLSSDQVINHDPLLEDYDIRNNIGGFKWSKIWNGSPLVSDVIFSYSHYMAKVEPNFSGSKPRENNVKDFTVNADFAYIYDSKDQLLFGVQNKYITTALKQENQLEREMDYTVNKSALAAYLNYKFFRWDDVGLDLGMRFNLLSMADKRPFLFEPRISITYLLNRLMIFKFAFGRYSQELVSLANEDELISVFEPWIIIPNNITAAEATHFI